jgi:hypothetical protein
MRHSGPLPVSREGGGEGGKRSQAGCDWRAPHVGGVAIGFVPSNPADFNDLTNQGFYLNIHSDLDLENFSGAEHPPPRRPAEGPSSGRRGVPRGPDPSRCASRGRRRTPFGGSRSAWSRCLNSAGRPGSPLPSVGSASPIERASTARYSSPPGSAPPRDWVYGGRQRSRLLSSTWVGAALPTQAVQDRRSSLALITADTQSLVSLAERQTVCYNSSKRETDLSVWSPPSGG